MAGASRVRWRAGFLRILHLRVGPLSAQSGYGNGPGWWNSSYVASARLDRSRCAEILAWAKPLHRNRPIDDRVSRLMFIFGVLAISSANIGSFRQTLLAMEDEDHDLGLIGVTPSGPAADER